MRGLGGCAIWESDKEDDGRDALPFRFLSMPALVLQDVISLWVACDFEPERVERISEIEIMSDIEFTYMKYFLLHSAVCSHIY